MPKGLDLHGRKFGRLIVVSMTHSKNGRLWLCKCECGRMKEKLLSHYELKHGKRNHCGCVKQKNGMKKHGMYLSRIYKVWSSMKSRCLNKNNFSFRIYGAKGVKVCDEWLDFQLFHNWAIASGYKKGLTIERKDNDGNYCPGNCTWIPKGKQSENTSRCMVIEYAGKKMILKQWARYLNMPYYLLQSRITKLGWSIERAFTEPVVQPNRCFVRLVTHNGRTMNKAEWARFIGLTPSALNGRLKRGSTIQKEIEKQQSA